MKLFKLILIFLNLFISIKLFAKTINFEKLNKKNCYKIFHENDKLDVVLDRKRFENMSNIFIAKITNDFIVKDKKVFMNFEVLANLKGNKKNFKLDSTYIYDFKKKIKLKNCNLLREASFTSHPRIMLIALDENINRIVDNQSIEDLTNFSSNSIGMYISDSGKEILTGINDLDIDPKSHREHLKNIRDVYKIFLSKNGKNA